MTPGTMAWWWRFPRRSLFIRVYFLLHAYTKTGIPSLNISGANPISQAPLVLTYAKSKNIRRAFALIVLWSIHGIEDGLREQTNPVAFPLRLFKSSGLVFYQSQRLKKNLQIHLFEARQNNNMYNKTSKCTTPRGSPNQRHVPNVWGHMKSARIL